MFSVFGAIGIIAIIAGGLLSAFTASKPTRLNMWASAYLVLIEGVLQVGLARGWDHLGKQSLAVATAAFVLYNAGNIGVLVGTALKNHMAHTAYFVNIGGGLLGVSMILLLISVRHAEFTWTVIGFYVLAAVILVSMPIGLILSRRRHNQ